MSAPALPEHTDPTTVEDLVSDHLDLADAIARRYIGRGIDRDDLTQVARLALVKAAQRYDTSRRTPFAAYASPCITGEIKRYFRDAGWMIRPPRRLQELGAQRRQIEAELSHRLGRRPTEAEVGAALGLDRHQLRAVETTAGLFTCVSLDAPSPSGDGASLGERGDVAIELEGTTIEERDWLDKAVAGLGEREIRVLRLRFVQSWTQDQIAEHLGVSQMQVSRILRATLATLRATMSSPLSMG